MGPIDVSWRVEATDYLDAAQLQGRRSWWFARAGVVLVAGLAFIEQVSGADATVWAPGYAIAAATIIYLLVWIPRDVHKRTRSLIGETATLRLDETGLQSDLAGFRFSAAWPTVVEVKENADSIVIRIDRPVSTFLPKRVFASPDELDSFLTYVRAHLGGAAQSASDGR